MDFIAMKCNLGVAVKQALEEIVSDEDGRKKAQELYQEIFLSHYNRVRDDMPQASLTGKVFTWKQYPDQKSRQYFEALIYEPKLNGHKTIADALKGKGFARIEAMEPEGQNQKKEQSSRRPKGKSAKRKHNMSPKRENPVKKRKFES